MSYNYETIKSNLFTDEGQRLLLKVRDNTRRLLKEAGAVRLQEAALAQHNTGFLFHAMTPKPIPPQNYTRTDDTL